MSEPEAPPPKTAIELVQNAQRQQLPKRFYTEATAAPRDGGFAILLDDRAVRTPAKQPLIVPTETLAAALADEWRAQRETIDPSTMPLTRIVNSALDGVTGREPEVRAEIVKYAGGDMLFYRAAGPAALVARHARHWDPIVTWAEKWLGARVVLVEGLMPVEQAPALLDAVAGKVAPLPPLPLAALHVVTTLTGSALLALALAEQYLGCEQAWAAAHVDEDHQIELWGTDGEAQARRAVRWREMQAAARILALS